MLKDKVIKPLLLATEKVVEYYFPEEKKHGEQVTSEAHQDDAMEGSLSKAKGPSTATIVNDDQTSVSS